VIGALRHSPQIRAVSQFPLVQEARIVEAKAEFDLRAFMESTFDRPSDPVGNVLVTGGPSRFREQNWSYAAGVRRKTTWGGSLEVSQRIGFQDNNSVFFLPPQQGNARLVLSFTQPLLRGAGESLNASRTVLAGIEAAAAWEQFSAELQDHLLRVTRAYWQLYLNRAALLQKQHLHEQANVILSDLEGRRTIDSSHSQIVRTRAAVAARRSELARARRNVQNAEARIRSLVNAPELSNGHDLELVPAEHPAQALVPVNLQEASRTALEYRPEIAEAVKKTRAAAVRLNVSRNELLPTLDLIMETYLSGLEGNGDIAQALGDQFSVGEPGYSVGLELDVPLGRRGAMALHQRRRLELRQLMSELDATAVTLLTEVEIAVGEVDTSYHEMQGKYHAMIAAEEDVRYLRERWRILPGEDRTASFLLEDLLDAQERLAAEQISLTRAQVDYTMALVELKRATGTLLQHENVTYRRVRQGSLPELILDKLPAAEGAEVHRSVGATRTWAR
jgi:outer membrane protein TolC